MKKLVSSLLVIVMLLSMCTLAFAAPSISELDPATVTVSERNELMMNYLSFDFFRPDQFLDVFDETADWAQIRSANCRYLDAIAAEVTAGIEDDRQKALAIHDWVCDNVYYDFDTYSGNINKELYPNAKISGVCEDYAKIYCEMCRSVGIPCLEVYGLSYYCKDPDNTTISEFYSMLDPNEGYGHAWNAVYVGGEWISVDCTWDSENSLVNGNYSESPRRYVFFDMTDESRDTTRLIDEMYFEIDDFEYKVFGSRKYIATCHIYTYTGKDEVIVIPSELNGIPVKGVDINGNIVCDLPKEIYISEGVEDICILNLPNISKFYIPASAEVVNLFGAKNSDVYYAGTLSQFKEKVELHSSSLFRDGAVIHFSDGTTHTHDKPIAYRETQPTCKQDVLRTYYCEECGLNDTYAIGNSRRHNDIDGDGLCDGCGISVSNNNGNDTEKELNFFEKIIAFFKRIIQWFENLF